MEHYRSIVLSENDMSIHKPYKEFDNDRYIATELIEGKPLSKWFDIKAKERDIFPNIQNWHISGAPHTVQWMKCGYFAYDDPCITASRKNDASRVVIPEDKSNVSDIVREFVKMLKLRNRYELLVFSLKNLFGCVGHVTVLVSVWKNLKSQESHLDEKDLERYVLDTLAKFRIPKISLEMWSTILSAVLDETENTMHMIPFSDTHDKVHRIVLSRRLMLFFVRTSIAEPNFVQPTTPSEKIIRKLRENLDICSAGDWNDCGRKMPELAAAMIAQSNQSLRSDLNRVLGMCKQELFTNLLGYEVVHGGALLFCLSNPLPDHKELPFFSTMANNMKQSPEWIEFGHLKSSKRSYSNEDLQRGTVSLRDEVVRHLRLYPRKTAE